MMELLFIPLAMVCLFVLAYRPLLFGTHTISTFQDNTYLLHPLLHHLSQSFGRGEYPYWVNSIMAGLPLYNSPQMSAEYPFYFLRFGLYSTPLAAMTHVHYVTLFHLFILYVNSYVLMRTVRLGPLSALFGASLFAFSPCVVLIGHWLNILAPYSWFPLAVASVVKLLEDGRRTIGVCLGTTSISLLVLASPSQPLIHFVLVVIVIYICYLVYYVRTGELRRLWEATIGLGLTALLAFVISSPAILPVLVDAPGMVRFLGDAGSIVGNAKIPFAAFLFGQVPPAALAASVLPLDIPVVLGNPFVGPGAALFALLAAFRYTYRPIVLAMILVTVWGLLSATGDHWGLAQLNYHIPLVDKIREPGRHLIVFVFGSSMLAAFGFESTTGGSADREPNVHVFRYATAVLVTCGLLVVGLNTPFHYIGRMSAYRLLGWFAATNVMLLALRWVSGPKRTMLAAGVALSVIYANAQYPANLVPWADGDYFSDANRTSHEILTELEKIEDMDDYRIIVDDDRLNTQFWSMNGSYHGIRGFQAYMNPLPFQQFEDVFQKYGVRHYYPLLGARYYLCRQCDRPVLDEYESAGEIGGYQLRVARQALPRYSTMTRLAGTYRDEREFMGKIDAGFDYRHEFYASEADAPLVRGWVAGKPAAAAVMKEQSRSLNGVTVSVNAPDRSMFVLNEFFTTAWKAWVNGTPVKPIRVNLNQVGVPMNAGPNLVHLEYRPTLFIGLLWLQKIVIGLAVACGLFVAWRQARDHFRRAGVTADHDVDEGDVIDGA